MGETKKLLIALYLCLYVIVKGCNCVYVVGKRLCVGVFHLSCHQTDSIIIFSHIIRDLYLCLVSEFRPSLKIVFYMPMQKFYKCQTN